MKTATRFGAHHEWGRLREVVIGFPPLAERVAREGVTVHRPDAAPPSVRDPLIVVADHAIESALRAPDRRDDRFGMRSLVQKAALERGARWSAVPPGWPNGVDGPFLEGGDVLLNGREVYVGMSGRASDMAGIDWLQALLGERYRVIPMAMRSDVPHLEDVLALFGPGLLAWCPEKLIDGLPMSLRGWDAIAVSPDEAARRATDGLILEEGRIMMESDNSRVSGELLKRRIDVIPVAFGGGLRSAYQPLWRESLME
jgi:N-dimethylarginine dimethylaminohydrolase